WREASAGAFSSLALFGAAGFTVDTPGGAISVRGVRASAGYFDTLGISAALGRTFAPADELPGHERVVVLSHAFWRERFGGRADVLGKTLMLSGQPYSIIGVMPAAVFPGWPVNPATVTIDPDASQFWVPIARTPQLDQSSRAHVFGVIGRLAPGITPSQARDMLNAATDPSATDAHGAHPAPLREQFVRDARTPLLALAGAALAILLIACANLAALHVTSFEARRHEFAVRAALGAGAGRLIRQLSLEALLLSLAGGLLGIGAARTALRALPELLPATVPFLTTPALDLRVAAFAIALAVAAGIIMTAWPIGRLVSSAPAPRGLPAKAGGAVYRLLVVSQLSVAVALVAVAGLLSQSLQSVRGQDPGFDIRDVFVADIGLPSVGPPEPRRVAGAEQAVLAAIARVPGVRAVAAAYDHPLEANWSETPTVIGDVTAPESRRQAELRIVSPGYFDALGVDILEGRALTPGDDLDAPGAIVVNEAFARDLDGRALGRRLRSGTPQFLYGDVAPAEFVIVGVSRNERFRGLESPAQPAFYLSTRQFPQTSLCILARTTGDPLAVAAAVRSAVRGIDRGITFNRATTMERILSEQLVGRRMTTSVIGGLAGAALALAALGLYGLLAVLVAGRTREIGIRLALGASPHRVARGVLRESLQNTIAGAAIGVVLAIAAGRFVQSLLVGVSPADPWTLATVAATLIGVSVLAALGPALRAARVEPVEALRAE
ncbi:MAG TPA: ADOP family duplicated permease, partial [Vicinamibacterales bacterium]|nr:ADOP family duplicated permease [Vicinamibacterales bacterium]